MSINAAKARLTQAQKDLLAHWMQTRVSWDDAISRRFEETHIRPLESDVRSAVGAMEQAERVLQRMSRDCS